MQVTAIDALAETYDVVLREMGIVPRVRTWAAHGERLLEHFSPASFDLAYSGNALDHAYDPLRVIRNMVELVRPDGSVVLRHHRNEDQAALYRGLHQWNFDLRDGELIVWNAEGEQNVSLLLAEKAETRCFVHGDEVRAVLVRVPGTPR